MELLFDFEQDKTWNFHGKFLTFLMHIKTFPNLFVIREKIVMKLLQTT